MITTEFSQLPVSGCKAVHLLHRVVSWLERSAHSMADLVVCHQRLAPAVHHGGAFHTRYNTIHAVIDLLLNQSSRTVIKPVPITLSTTLAPQASLRTALSEQLDEKPSAK